MFDLENAFREWRKNLLKNPGIAENQALEIEAELREEIEDLTAAGLSREEAFRRATSDMAPADTLGSEFYKARKIRGSGRPPWKAPRYVPVLFWNYSKVAIRKIKRRKSHALINIAGLSVAMACFLLISTFIQFELSFDRFYENSERMFRVALRNGSPDVTGYSLSTPEILSTAMKNSIPEIEAAGIVQNSRDSMLQVGDERYTESGLFADADFFKLFSYELIEGNPASVLAAPDAVVISGRLAEKLFGEDDPLGRTIRFKGRFLSRDLGVTGVVRNPPKNSHLQFDFLVSTATMAASENLKAWFKSWNSYAFQTYVRLGRKQDRPGAEKKILALIEAENPDDRMREDMVFLQPITDIHLRSNVAGATATNNRIQTVWLFGSIALIILLIAGINAMNLSTARAIMRNKEVGMRKVIGARRIDLIFQFMGESYFITGLAMVCSFLLFHLFFPVFSSFSGTALTLGDIDPVPLALSVAGTILFVGAFSGFYPALILSAFQPTAVEKQLSPAWGMGARVRNLLVVLQFSAVTVLMIGTIVITRQLNFIRHKNLGYDREHVVVLPLRDEEAVGRAAALKTRLEEYSRILSVTISDSTPLGLGASLGGVSVQRENGENVKIDMSMAAVDTDFLEVYEIELAEGRNFLPGHPGDDRTVLVNQALVREVGWKDPLGRELNDSTVIGVMKDFHFDTLHKPIGPAALIPSADFYGRIRIGIRIRPEETEGTLARIRGIFKDTMDGRPFDYYFLDDAYDRLYRNEQRLAGMIGYLEGLAILLGCMGLFGLATSSAQRRSKEIGIRKVLGASMISIVRMMSREFVTLVAIANLIAWPLGYYFLRRWLQAYAYRCPFGLETFLLAGLATLLIALTAVGLQTVRASLADPVVSLRYE